MQPISPFPLKSFNTFGLDAQAKMGFVLNNEAELDALRGSTWWSDSQPRLLIGEGSNILFTADFDGVVIVNRLKGISVQETADAWLLHVAAGENWPALIQWTLQHQMPGMENLALIPGTVGAAPVQNIGAYGVEFCQFCEYVDTWHFADGHRQRYSAAACQFGYRDSLFKHALHDQVIITAVGLRIPKQWQPVVEYGPLKALGANATAEQIFMTVCELRQSKLPDPSLLGNAGSFFKNPVVSATQAAALKQLHPAIPCFAAGEGQNKLAAGWLIDKAGLKGFSLGNAGVHRDQALVLVNLGNASAAEILQLAKHVASTVKQQFSVQLEPEVRFIGKSGEINSLQAIQ
ncbi:UDP-N-acetylmuramate dehydrogenase [uncultured Tolumonas sp.]|uniref:UDP-N-acetylmuramate dehydrogenase n=1 Tax=uncultured Tolumonas sp. TaxID=263765 RepID=UPI00292DF254|nr:UDP-N-acetylmuramate dehydrogenase [uncultured Tolumonas sp.]